MKELPILFTGPMVRAILDGRKTQTRRIVKPQPSETHWEFNPGYKLRVSEFLTTADHRGFVNFHHTIPQNPEWDKAGSPYCPYGIPGDLLWVRETFTITAGPIDDEPLGPDNTAIVYRASWDVEVPYCPLDGAWKPSIHMPRWASRINLEITGVRVERLQNISEEDAKAEGAPCEFKTHERVMLGANSSYLNGFNRIWRSINGQESWDANPWVWVLEFRRLQT